ncbi:MAG TPA: GntR family transcriptional regulator [Gemmataceae bacterium]|nr:GntR family transcriptional regulator [Gemmataceae bacterium]
MSAEVNNGRDVPLVSGTAGSAARSLLKDRAYVELKRQILGGAFAPGAFLSERQIAGQLAMSKTPIRAAVGRLEAEGFLTISPQQGIVVRDLSIHEIADQFEIRAALEPFVLRHLAGRLTREQTTRLQLNLNQQKASVRRQETECIIELDTGFHMMLCEFHGNREMVRVMEQLRAKIHRVILRVNNQNPNRFLQSYEEHRRIADALIAGDAEEAVRQMMAHLEYGKHSLLSPRHLGTREI